jgi:hypothetical protein
MYSITDAHKALSCGRSTVYSIMKEAGIETTKSGLSQLMTDEQFQRLQEIYFEKYPNRKPKEFIQERSSTFRVDLESNEVEVLESKQQTRSYEDVLEEKAKIFARTHQRDAEHIEDLRKQLEGKDRIIESLLEIIKNQKEPASKPKASATVQRTPPKFPEYDPNVDTLTGDLFDQPIESESSAQNPRVLENSSVLEFLKGNSFIRRHVKPCSWQPSAFPDDMVPIDADEAVLQFFKGRIPQRTTDFDGLLQHMERVGFPQVSTGALSSRITKLRKQQQAERKARDQLKQV